jgi:DNA-binding NarL/FixJ family response regulator
MPIKYDLETDIRYQQGKAAGVAEGIAHAFEKGFMRGFTGSQETIALRCLEQGMPVEQIARLIYLSEARVAELQASLNRP